MSQYIDMPRLGLGTWQLEGQKASDTVAQAIQLGYRHIDTAPRYDNEAAVGKGLQQSGVDRKELFVTTKIWHDQLAPEAMRRSAAASLERLQLDTVDLLLIHWPNPDPAWRLGDSLQTLLEIKQQGWAKNIGVANFPVALLQQAWGILGEELKVNQVEYTLPCSNRLCWVSRKTTICCSRLTARWRAVILTSILCSWRWLPSTVPAWDKLPWRGCCAKTVWQRYPKPAVWRICRAIYRPHPSCWTPKIWHSCKLYPKISV